MKKTLLFLMTTMIPSLCFAQNTTPTSLSSSYLLPTNQYVNTTSAPAQTQQYGQPIQSDIQKNTTKKNEEVSKLNETLFNSSNNGDKNIDVKGMKFSGYPKIIDGKTIILNGVPIVLDGSDVPAESQSCTDQHKMEWWCGQKSRSRLEKLINYQKVVCTGVSKLKNGIAADCFVGTINLGKTMISEGWAVVPKEVQDKYANDENNAHLSKRGMWIGNFQMPWDAR